MNKQETTFDAASFLVGLFAPTDSALTPDLADRMKTHKGELRPEGSQTDENTDVVALADGEAKTRCDRLLTELAPEWTFGDVVDWESLPEPVTCPTCGGFDCWWDVWDRRRCSACDPPWRPTR